MVVEREGNGWAEPRILCRHDSSRHHHRVHVHPRVHRNGRSICFNSDARGYGDAYVLALPDEVSSLPLYPGKTYLYYWE